MRTAKTLAALRSPAQMAKVRLFSGSEVKIRVEQAEWEHAGAPTRSNDAYRSTYLEQDGHLPGAPTWRKIVTYPERLAGAYPEYPGLLTRRTCPEHLNENYYPEHLPG